MSIFFQPLRFVVIFILCLTLSNCKKNTISKEINIPVTPNLTPIPDQDTIDQINNRTLGVVGTIDPCIANPTAPGCPGYVDPCVPPVPGCPGYVAPCIPPNCP